MTARVLVAWILVGSPSPDEVVEEPVEGPAAPTRPADPKRGGFGTVEAVATNSQIEAQPLPSSEPEPERRRQEIGGRLEVGFGQSDVENAKPFDHLGARLAGALQWYPYVTPRRRAFGIGVELAYAYQGFNRKRLPEPEGGELIEASKVQQHFVSIGLPLLLRPHPEWFSIQPTGSIGVALFSGNEIYANDRFSTLPGRTSALGAAGTLALCTAFDIVCVIGGYRWVDGVPASDRAVIEGNAAYRFTASTWYVGLGFDVLRMFERFNTGAEPVSSDVETTSPSEPTSTPQPTSEGTVVNPLP